jgi:diguanylate cyclase (GGDEF)-like protein/PAS domain S-box-containing protein
MFDVLACMKAEHDLRLVLLAGMVFCRLAGGDRPHQAGVELFRAAPDRRRAAIGGGVGLMHYVGMSAVLSPGRIEWSTELVVASLAWSLCLSSAAMWVTRRGATIRHLLSLALFLALAICGPNFTAVAAAHLAADPSRASGGLAYSSGATALGAAGATAAVLALALIGALTERRLARQAEAFGAEIGEIKEQAARESQITAARLRDAIDAIPEGLALFDAEDRYLFWNKRYAEIYDIGAQLRKGLKFEDAVRSIFARGVYHSDEANDEALVQGRLARQSVVEREMADGRWIQVAERRTSEGGTVAVHVDITELKRREASFRLLLESNPIPILVYDTRSLRMLTVNDAATKHYKYSRAQFLRMSLLDICEENDRIALIETLSVPDEIADLRAPSRHVKADGEKIDVVVYSRPLHYEGQEARIAAVFDVTECKKREDRIVYLAHHDILTGLPNRASFGDRLSGAIAEADAKRATIAILCLDLDRFKEVNDVFGHAIGDKLLRAVSEKLVAAGEGAQIARVGGDEFTVIVAGESLQERASDTAGRLRKAAAEPFEIAEYGSPLH